MSIAFPLFYYVLSILLGLYVTGWFPYWFMNPLRTSWTMIVVWFVVLLLVFLCFDWIFITLSRKMEKRDIRSLPAGSAVALGSVGTTT